MKLRLHGTPAEVAEATRHLTRIFEVVAVSPPYPDRDASVLVRVYVEIRLDPSQPTTRPRRPGEVPGR